MHFLRRPVIIPFLLIFLFATGCASFKPDIYNQSFSQLKESSQAYLEKKEYAKSLILTRTLLDAEPDNAEVRAMQDEALTAKPKYGRLIDKKLMGSNLTDRVPNENFPIAGKILLYVPNRILDALDVITLESGICFGVGASLNATKFVAGGAQISAGELMLGLNRRHLSARVTIDDFIEVFPFDARTFMESRVYTGGVYAVSQHKAGMKQPGDKIYQRARDFWAFGGQAQALILAVRSEIHPLEIVDFFSGLAMIDFLNDDIGTSKGTKITKEDKKALARLAKQASRRR